MIYLFIDMLKFINVDLNIMGIDIVINVIRIGKVIIWINLFLSELEIVFYVFNELFYLMILLLLDKYFCNFEIG